MFVLIQRWCRTQELLTKPQTLFALALSPTRELAIQIAEQFEALGASIGVKCAVLVGGIDMMAQVCLCRNTEPLIILLPCMTADKGYVLVHDRVWLPCVAGHRSRKEASCNCGDAGTCGGSPLQHKGTGLLSCLPLQPVVIHSRSKGEGVTAAAFPAITHPAQSVI